MHHRQNQDRWCLSYPYGTPRAVSSSILVHLAVIRLGHWASEFAGRILAEDWSLNNQYQPILETAQESSMLHISITFVLTYHVSFNLVNPVALSLKNDLIVQGKFICLQNGTKKKRPNYSPGNWSNRAWGFRCLSFPCVSCKSIDRRTIFFVRSSHIPKVMHLLSFKVQIARAAMLWRPLVLCDLLVSTLFLYLLLRRAYWATAKFMANCSNLRLSSKN